MEKPPSQDQEKSLAEVVWDQLVPTEDPKVRLASEAWLEEVFSAGAVDSKRFRLPQWKAAFASLPKEEGGIQVSREQWVRLSKFLYPGKVKKPFEPPRLKDGPRPVAWLTELYQKVLRFETNLSFEAWKKLMADEVQPRFVKGERVLLNAALKAYLSALLDKNPSPLRKLELWFLEKSQKATKVKSEGGEEKPASLAKPISIKDTFESQDGKREAIDKLYYHHEQHPALDDKESLDFLDQLARLEGDDKLEE